MFLREGESRVSPKQMRNKKKKVRFSSISQVEILEIKR